MKKRTVLADVIGIANPTEKTEKFGIIVNYPGMSAKDNGVRRLSDKVLEAIAENAGFPDFESLASLIRMSLDKGQLEITLEERKAGETWENSVTGESGVIKETHEAITGIPVFIPSDEIAEEIKTVNRELLRDKLRNKKTARKINRSFKAVVNPFDAVKAETEEAKTEEAETEEAETEEAEENLAF